MARERSVSDVWRSAGHFAASYKACISREICTVPSLYRPSTDGLIPCVIPQLKQ